MDWIGVSIFQQVFPWASYWGGTLHDIDEVLVFASKLGKVSNMSFPRSIHQYLTADS